MEDIYARAPVNRVAVRVTGVGEHFSPRTWHQGNDSDFPIKTKPFTAGGKNACGDIDLTGRRVGRLTVIGVASDIARNWVVRCDCGRYSTRTAKAIKNPENTQDRCVDCRYLAYLKRSEAYRRTGRNTDIREF